MSVSLCISFSGQSCSRSVKGAMDLIIGGRDLAQGVSSASPSGGVGGGGTVGGGFKASGSGSDSISSSRFQASRLADVVLAHIQHG